MNARLYKFVMWLLEQADKRAALDMNIDDFMAQCPASVRAAAAKPAAAKKAVSERKAARSQREE